MHKDATTVLPHDEYTFILSLQNNDVSMTQVMISLINCVSTYTFES
jgi:hypothetical protein